MALVKWHGGRGGPVARLRREMDDLFRDFFQDWNWPLEPAGEGTWWPDLDLAERDDALLVTAELPGIDPGDIDISVKDGTLSITGEKKQAEEEQKENYYRAERRYGRFRRDIPLPASVDPDKVDAKYENGVLRVTMPKSEQARPKRIPVKT